MADDVRLCPDHGFFEQGTEPSCPDCGASGQAVLDGNRRRRLSKFVSGALRHFPDDVGLTLDVAGWTDVDALVAAVTRKYEWASEREVRAVLATDPKGRFERRERRVRAAYGHSVDVDLDHSVDRGHDGDAGRSGDDLPAQLYHGTAPRNADAIERDGLKPMGRQLVHLSGDVATAREVGRRHADGESVVFAVEAERLHAAGFEVRKRGRSTYTVERVPPSLLTRIEASASDGNE